MSIEDKIAEYEFDIPTTLSFEEVLQRSENVVAGFRDLGRRVTTLGHMTDDDGADSMIGYELTNLKFWTLGKFALTHYEEDGHMRLRFDVVEMLRTRTNLFYFIPVTPYTTPGLWDFRILSARLRRALER
ncbi:hypothetical protein [Schaalia canis]|uniref:Uncharacterized protein n=1 Tax=Schaalia canis TaxID=100469 RepID=A0A3P1SG70_9ACTO|nr:hypothetical protein [Schaalia canis]RRC95342.1 hypothetical protein EII11_05540 [Schaalia canis]